MPAFRFRIVRGLAVLLLAFVTLAAHDTGTAGTARAASAAAATAAAGTASTNCGNPEAADPPLTKGAPPIPADASAPRMNLQNMVREAVRRSNAIGAAKLLAEAAEADVKETRAGALPLASISGNFGAADSVAPNTPTVKGRQERASLNVGAPLYDGGRIKELTGWRKSLAESARLGQITAQEEVGLQTVSLALDRSRYRLQAQVNQQYARKMSCLIEALEQIVKADKGRASELVQARKSLQQVELSQAQTASALRQVEIRLRRFVGDGLPSAEGMSSVLVELPPLEKFLAEADRAPEMIQLDAQVQALASYSRSVVAAQKPQVSWSLSASKTGGVGSNSALSGGVNVTIPIFAPGVPYTIDASQKRAEAARLQRDDALEARKSRMADVYEQAASSFDRARRTIEVVRTSDTVRNYTLLQWQQMGRRSLFDVMGAEGDYYGLRIAYINALFDGEQANALLRSLGLGLSLWLE